MKRIVVVGSTGSGKSTLAQQLAERMNAPHIELDALHWEPNWTPAAPEVFMQRVNDAIAGESWTCSGNYSGVRDRIWQRADTVIWLNYSFPVVASRLLRRTLRRVVSQEELWNGNRESYASCCPVNRFCCGSCALTGADAVNIPRFWHDRNCAICKSYTSTRRNKPLRGCTASINWAQTIHRRTLQLLRN
jgi:energy-coupling factor transporter ATP-binding protein EcfA2